MSIQIQKKTVFVVEEHSFPTMEAAKKHAAALADRRRFGNLVDKFNDASTSKHSTAQLNSCELLLRWLDKRGMLLPEPKPKPKKKVTPLDGSATLASQA